MNSNLILKSDILDIIFEKRNKAYGAYTLRKLYPNRLKRSLTIMLLSAGGFLSFMLFAPKANHVNTFVYEIPSTELGKTATKPKEQPQRQEVVKPKSQTRPVNQKQLTSNPLIVSTSVKTDPIQAITDNDAIGNKTITDAGTGPVLIQPQKTETGLTGTEPLKIDKKIPLGLGDVDVPPAFPGGMEALLNFLRRHLNNPEPMNEGESVSVKVTFVVNYEGKLQGFRILEDGGEVFNKEVIRVLKKMPDWIPGKAKGENVSVYYTIPVKFTGAD